MNLQIFVLKDVPRTVIGNVEITGLKRDSRESLLKYLQLAPGDVLDAPTLQRINDLLTQSCRYWMHGIVVSLSSDDVTQTAQPHQGTLKLDLEEYEPAPPLDKPLSATDETVRKCASWFKSIGTDLGGYDVVCSTESIDVGSGAQQAQFGLASDGTLFVEATVSTTQGMRANHTLILSPPAIEIYDWGHQDKFCLSRPYRPKFSMQMPCQHTIDGKQAGCLSFGFAFDAADANAANAVKRHQFHIEPVALLYFVNKMDAKTESRHGIFALKSETLEIRIDEKTGSLRAVKGAAFLEAGVAAIDFKSGPGLLTAARPKFPVIVLASRT